eukprot:1140831-Rhodomonas_salina.1
MLQVTSISPQALSTVMSVVDHCQLVTLCLSSAPRTAALQRPAQSALGTRNADGKIPSITLILSKASKLNESWQVWGGKHLHAGQPQLDLRQRIFRMPLLPLVL